MFAITKTPDPFEEFAQRLVRNNMPPSGVRVVDQLFADVTTHYGFLNNDNCRDEIEARRTAIRDLSDEDAGLGMAALLIVSSAFKGDYTFTPLLKFFWVSRGGKMLWTQVVAISLLENHTNRKGQPVDPYTIPILERSFPRGMPRRIKGAIRRFLDSASVPVMGLDEEQPSLLRRLEVLAGRDPSKNQLLLRQKATIGEYLEFQDKFIREAGPIMRTGINEAIAAEGESIGVLKTWYEQTKSMSPQERGVLFADFYKRRKLCAHPGYKWATRLPNRHPDAIHLDRIGWPPGLDGINTTDKAVVFTEEHAKSVITECIFEKESDPDSHMHRSLTGPQNLLKTAPEAVYLALADAFEKPDEELASFVRKHHSFSPHAKILLNKLCPFEVEMGPRQYKGNKYQRYLAEKRDDFYRALVRLPDMWVTVAKQDSDGGSEGELRHQLFPYYRELNGFIMALNNAQSNGINIREDAERLVALFDAAANNWQLLRAGQYVTKTFNQVVANFPIGEAVPTINLYWHGRVPEPEKELFDRSGNPKVDLMLKIERRFCLENIQKLQGMLERCPREGLAGALVNLFPTGSMSRPTKSWIKRAAKSLDKTSLERILMQLSEMTAVQRAEFDYNRDLHVQFAEHADFEKRMIAMLWAAHLAGPAAATVLYDFALKAYAKIPGVGVTNEKLGNAATVSLALLPDGTGAASLMLLERKTQYSHLKKRLVKLLDEVAEKSGLARIKLEERSVSDHGFANCSRRIALMSGAAVLSVGRLKVGLSWEDEKGVARKSLPKVTRQADSDGVKAARKLAKDIEADLVTWKDRIEKTYLEEVSWAYDDWRKQYAEHGTLAALARGLVWTAKKGDDILTMRPTENGCVDAGGNAVDCADAEIRLWHPIDATFDETQAWRQTLMAEGIIQPFRQAWRETYSLTDAERKTGSYSNRFAGHILRQHQMRALATANGWRAANRVGFDQPDTDPTHIRLPDFGLQAEYWTQAVRRDSPTTARGSYLYIATDRVKFHSLAQKAKYGRGAEAALESVPPRVFSEIMRHCDLFTSVTSICADPEWRDRGEDADHPSKWRLEADGYWSMGQEAPLTRTAEIRKEMISLLLPQLKQASAFSLRDRHLLVRGTLHEYLIHLGSAGVIIKSRQQHLCIVPKASSEKTALPFDHDATLSLIMSKAFLLINDDKIEDPVILQQIR